MAQKDSEKDNKETLHNNTVTASGAGSVAIGHDSFAPINTGTATYGEIHVNTEVLNGMPSEYADSLKKFMEEVNKSLNKNKVPADKIGSAQKHLDELAKETSEIKPNEEVTASKEFKIGGALSNTLDALASASPSIAETVVSCIPILSPFSKLIGKGVEKLVERFRKKEKSTDDKR